MSGSFVGKIDCPKCGNENSLNMWEEDDVRTGYCFHHSCKSYFNERALSEAPDSDVAYTEKEPYDISWVSNLKAMDNVTRGLKAGAYRHFGVVHGVSTQDGRTLSETYYPLRDAGGETIAMQWDKYVLAYPLDGGKH